MSGLEAWPVEGLGEVVPGTDLATLLDGADLRDGDVVLVTSKVVSKAEGRVAEEDRDTAVREETVRVVARRGGTRIVENPLGLVMAAAGVDASNVTPGHVVRLPLDPDGSARRLRDDLRARRGVVVAVVVTDTAGRAWRTGQTEIAVGVAGIAPVEPMSGATDSYGNPLVVTAPAVADELANVGELVTGKLGGRPVAVVRGLAERVLPATDHGPGARALLRPREQDMFALGSREAVVAALRGAAPECFGDPAAPDELREALSACGVVAEPGPDGTVLVEAAADHASAVVVRALAHAHGWVPEAAGPTMRLRPSHPAP